MSATIASVGGPKFSGTKAEKVRHHDDKDAYTGVYAQGGPTNVDSVHPVASFGSAPAQEESKGPAKKKLKTATTVSEEAGSVEEVFYSYTAKAPEMDGKTLAKLAKDTKILDKKLTSTDIDLIFAKVKAKAARKITLPQFMDAIT